MRPPYTLGWLTHWLSENYSVDPIRIAWSPITLYLELWVLTADDRYAIEVRRQVIQIIPCNINLQLLKQLPFPEVDNAVTSLWSINHKMAIHESIGIAIPDILIEPAATYLWVVNHKMTVHESIGRIAPKVDIDLAIASTWTIAHGITIYKSKGHSFPQLG